MTEGKRAAGAKNHAFSPRAMRKNHKGFVSYLESKGAK